MSDVSSPGLGAQGATLPRVRTFPLARALGAAFLAMVGFAGAGQAQTQWLVDASGGGDFTDLQAAIDQAIPGDVLRILPGTYGDAQLTKALSLIGNPDLPKPVISSLDIQSAPTFSLQHLTVRQMRVEGGTSRAVIDLWVPETLAASFRNPQREIRVSMGLAGGRGLWSS